MVQLCINREFLYGKGRRSSMKRPLSALARPEIIEDLESTTFDLLIIGGGITGAGIAWDAAKRGIKTALIERDDFASGTSSRSTKLIHGGLRYLKKGEVSLVREVGREREWLYGSAPHLVTPMPMLLPIYKGGTFGYWSASMGLMLYDRLAGVEKEERRVMHRAGATARLEPLLKGEGLKGGGLYYEYRSDDARLTIEVLKTAVRHGAWAVNYVEATGFRYYKSKVSGVVAVDHLTGNEIEIKAKRIVNAAGPWVDLVRANDHAIKGKNLLLTKGIHLVVSHSKLPVRQAAYFDVPDGRMIFVIPRGGKTYIGTTDTVYSGDPAKLRITEGDRDYLLAAVMAIFPRSELKAEDVESMWAGLRPLIREEGKKPSDVSRRDEIWESPSGLITIAGGKLTGFRKMAEKAVDMISRSLEREARHAFGPCTTAKEAISGGDGGRFETYGELREQLLLHGVQKGLSLAAAEYLLGLYGSNTQDIYMKLAGLDSRFKAWGQPEAKRSRSRAAQRKTGSRGQEETVSRAEGYAEKSGLSEAEQTAQREERPEQAEVRWEKMQMRAAAGLEGESVRELPQQKAELDSPSLGADRGAESGAKETAGEKGQAAGRSTGMPSEPKVVQPGSDGAGVQRMSGQGEGTGRPSNSQPLVTPSRPKASSNESGRESAEQRAAWIREWTERESRMNQQPEMSSAERAAWVREWSSRRQKAEDELSETGAHAGISPDHAVQGGDAQADAERDSVSRGLDASSWVKQSEEETVHSEGDGVIQRLEASMRMEQSEEEPVLSADAGVSQEQNGSLGMGQREEAPWYAGNGEERQEQGKQPAVKERVDEAWRLLEEMAAPTKRGSKAETLAASSAREEHGGAQAQDRLILRKDTVEDKTDRQSGWDVREAAFSQWGADPGEHGAADRQAEEAQLIGTEASTLLHSEAETKQGVAMPAEVSPEANNEGLLAAEAWELEAETGADGTQDYEAQEYKAREYNGQEYIAQGYEAQESEYQQQAQNGEAWEHDQPLEAEDYETAEYEAVGYRPQEAVHYRAGDSYEPSLEAEEGHADSGNEPLEFLLLKAELRYCIEEEMVVNAADFLIRRTGLLYFDRERAEEIAIDVIEIMAELLGWNEAEVMKQKLQLAREWEAATVAVGKE
jgi:glycerol-3-phosphate dehydrogenase